jgi:hypothetical protein
MTWRRGRYGRNNYNDYDSRYVGFVFLFANSLLSFVFMAFYARDEQRQQMIVSWFSAGVSSAVATKIALQKYPDLLIIYQHINDQHPDTLRFVNDCEKWFERPVLRMQGKYKTVDEAVRGSGFLVSAYGAGCTRLLKRRLRMDWEAENPSRHTYIWGFDANEDDRAQNRMAEMPKHDHAFPLVEHGLDKKTVHGIIEVAGIKRPAMYDMGYPNNNCIGCVKGGAGYWQKIKKDFPDVFQSRAKLERVIGRSILRRNKESVFLDELPDDFGRDMKIIVPECGFFCEVPHDNKIWDNINKGGLT